ncbi:UDP-Glc:alpha-D-GlcNAc-diphosphoundecaprenol beta-1,3-glucosyltransferase WfgD [compost metagenome]
MATYNRSHFILEALSSIQNQTYTNWECLIIDDGGTDNTFEVITPIVEQDSRFKFLKRPDNYKKGLPGCRNYGLDLATGYFIIFFDDDDIVHPNNLKICTEILSDENLDFCHYQKLAFEKENPLIEKVSISRKVGLSKADIEKIVTEKIGLASCTVMWKRSCFEEVRFNEDLMYAEEWECYSRIISKNFKGIIIDSILYFNRKHEASNTADFYNNNRCSLASKKEAIVLILKNLKQKQLLTNSLIRYFVTISLDFKEYNLFNEIIKILDLSVLKRMKWIFFYRSYPLRMLVYKIKKSLK